MLMKIELVWKNSNPIACVNLCIRTFNNVNLYYEKLLQVVIWITETSLNCLLYQLHTQIQCFCCETKLLLT